MWNVPNCFGAIDGKHITIQCPPNSGSLFFNYKKTFSIVLMAACDHLYRFTLVDVGAYGGNSDEGIFADSSIGHDLRNENLNLPTGTALLPGSNIGIPGFFLADDAFQLSTRIMKPFSGKRLGERKNIYNYRISRGRRTIENSFGIFASKWRIFRRPICMRPKTADVLVSSTVCLHNFVSREEAAINRHTRYNEEPCEADKENPHWRPLAPVNMNGRVPLRGPSAAEALQQRELLSNYFLTPQGEVPWQYEYVRRGQFQDTN